MGFYLLHVIFVRFKKNDLCEVLSTMSGIRKIINVK